MIQWMTPNKVILDDKYNKNGHNTLNEILSSNNLNVRNLRMEQATCNNVPEIQVQLFQRIIANDKDEVSELIHQGVNINFTFANGRTPLMEHSFNIEMINHLLKLGADPNIYGRESLLHSFSRLHDFTNIESWGKY
jgi:ankyrin repeat protein